MWLHMFFRLCGLPLPAVGAQQRATIDPTLNLCTRHPLRHFDLSRCPLLHKSLQPPCITDCKGSDTTWELRITAGWAKTVRNVKPISTHGQHWEGTPDLLILSPMPYPLGHTLPPIYTYRSPTKSNHLTHISHVTSTPLCCYLGWQIRIWVPWKSSQSSKYLLSYHVTWKCHLSQIKRNAPIFTTLTTMSKHFSNTVANQR